MTIVARLSIYNFSLSLASFSLRRPGLAPIPARRIADMADRMGDAAATTHKKNDQALDGAPHDGDTLTGHAYA